MAKHDHAYFSRSNAIVTSEKGWVKLLLVMGLAQFVPVVGTLGVSGYALEHARLVAWGSDAAPKRKGVKAGTCIASGWRGLVAGIGYVFAAGVLNGLLATLLGDGALTGLIELAINLLVGVIYVVAGLRATIYQNFVAGYRLDRMWDMTRENPEGLAIISLINALATLIVALATLFVALILVISILFNLFAASSLTMNAFGSFPADAIAQMAGSIISILPWLLVVAYFGTVSYSFVTLIVYTAVGLWMRDFNVPAWGASEDPLPEGVLSAGESSKPASPIATEQQVPAQQTDAVNNNDVDSQSLPASETPVDSTPEESASMQEKEPEPIQPTQEETTTESAEVAATAAESSDEAKELPAETVDGGEKPEEAAEPEAAEPKESAEPEAAYKE